MSLSDHLRLVAGYSEVRPLRRVERHALEQAAQRLLDLEAQLQRASDSADTLAQSLRAVERRLATERHAHNNTRQALVLAEAEAKALADEVERAREDRAIAQAGFSLLKHAELMREFDLVDETVAHGLRSPVSGALVPVPDPSRMGARRGFVLSRRCESADGIQQVYRFPNGYGASVVRGRVFGLENAGKWRVAITLWQGEDFRVLDEVIGFLAASEVEVCLLKVEEMAPGAYPYDLADKSVAPWALVPGGVQTERRCGDCSRIYVAGSAGWRKVGGIDSCPTCRAKNPSGWLAKAADGVVADMDAGGAL